MLECPEGGRETEEREAKSYSTGAGEPTRPLFPFRTRALFGPFVVSRARFSLRYEVLCVSEPTPKVEDLRAVTPACLGSVARANEDSPIRGKNLCRRGRRGLSTDDPRTS